MISLTDNKIILIKSKTRLEKLIMQYNTMEQAKFYIEHLGSDFSEYISEDKIYKEALKNAQLILDELGKLHIVEREFVPNFMFGKNDLIIALGQDGLVANTLKYLSNQLLIGVNPDPKRLDGVLLPFKVHDLSLIVKEVFEKKRPISKITMAKATLNDGQSLYAVNDLFIGQKTHTSSRYKIEINNKSEIQSSSGIIISTGLGSTGWLKSILIGAYGISNTNNTSGQNINMKWDSKYLHFAVREPFPSNTTKTNIVFGKIQNNNPLKISSQMPENGVIFSDGIESDFLHFNSGIEAKISIADKAGYLIK